MKKTLVTLFLATAITTAIATTLGACSTTNTNTRLDKKGTQTGTVLAVKSTYIKPETLHPRVGVSIGSGGYRGIYGGFDVGNVVRAARDANHPNYRQILTVQQSNGDTVAITQISRQTFKPGDAVKLILVNGEARVIH